MNPPTLADVLARHAKIAVAERERDEYVQRVKADGRFGGEQSSYQRWLETAEWEAKAVALQFILSNRTALERFELEQAARKAVGAEVSHLAVVFTEDDSAPRIAKGEFYAEESGAYLEFVEAGLHWKPEVNRG